MKINLTDADVAALKAFVDDDASQDPEANIALEIHFSYLSGWRVIIDVYESTSHVTAEGEWCPTMDAAFTSAYQAF